MAKVIKVCTLPFSIFIALGTQAAPLSLSQQPLFIGPPDTPMVMLTMSRDHTLYYEAYNDASDLDGNGYYAIRYEPGERNYYGYFDSFKCYKTTGSGDSQYFYPTKVSTTKKCPGEWSGDFLNYLTTSRIDALRKVLYGGRRSTDTASQTILQRAILPQDAHSWGKSYTSVAVDGYSIADYTPYALPSPGKRHLFANTTWGSGTFGGWAEHGSSTQRPGAPRLLVLKDETTQIWEWVAKEQAVADKCVFVNSGAGKAGRCSSGDRAVTPDQFNVRVEVCKLGSGGDTSLLEDNCVKYSGGNYKPTGLLHTYGMDNSMHFGLLTGSYLNNKQGGVLRKRVSSFTNEVDPKTGQFKSLFGASEVTDDGSTLAYGGGIVDAINSFRTIDFNYPYGPTSSYSECGWITDRSMKNGECRDWGNPVAEMLYEGLRYFAGKESPTPEFLPGSADSTLRSDLKLGHADWDDPWSKRNYCTPAYNLLISGTLPNFDADSLPGSEFTPASGKPTDALEIESAKLTQYIGAQEGFHGKDYFIGEALGFTGGAKGAPTPKTISDLARVRGLSPEEPTKEGSFYSAGVALHGNVNDLRPELTKHDGREQTVRQFVVALSSPLPEIKVPVNGKIVTLVPFAKSVGGSAYSNSVSSSPTAFQPTNTIVDFFVESLTYNAEKQLTAGRFRINFEDVEQGADHDMDMIVLYDFAVEPDPSASGSNRLRVTLTSEYAAGSIDQHAGYVISGTDKADGIYLDIQDVNGANVAYYLDTFGADDRPYPNNKRNNTALSEEVRKTRIPGNVASQSATRFFKAASSGTSASLLPSPLELVAKWGGFKDTRVEKKLPDGTTEIVRDYNQFPEIDEWDADNDGKPDNYFLVTNPSRLREQLGNAFADIKRDASDRLLGLGFSSGSIRSDSALYATSFVARDWSGELAAYDISKLKLETGDLAESAIKWRASNKLDAQDHGKRALFTQNSQSKNIVAFQNVPSTTALSGSSTGLSFEQVSSLLTGFTSSKAADRLAEINRRIQFLRGSRTDETTKYRERKTRLGDIVDSAPVAVPELGVVAVGANDGMLHVFNADDGSEVFGYIPSATFNNLHQLTQKSYNHRYFVNGAPVARRLGTSSSDPYLLVGGLGGGGQGIYALDLSKAKSATSTNHNNTVMWEFTDRNHPDLGYTYSQPVITKVGSSDMWVVVFGNGYNSSEADTGGAGSGEAGLFVVNAKTGALIGFIGTGVGSEDTPNGLSTPFVVDYDKDGLADYAYAGDLRGNLWGFDLRSLEVAHKDGDTPVPLFVAKDADGKTQPITAPPTAAYHPDGGLLVLFGTGKYLETSDNVVALDETTQSYYAIWDNIDSGLKKQVSRSRLQQQTIDFEGKGRRVTSTNQFVYGTGVDDKEGWYLDLLSPVNGVEGERLVTKSNLRFNKVAFTTLIPDDVICASGGRGWIMELDIFFGKRWSKVDIYDEDGEIITENLPKIGSKEVKGVAGNTSTVIYDEEMNALSLTPTSGDKPQVSIETDEPKGRQSWLQLF